jgi:hypothetical protein
LQQRQLRCGPRAGAMRSEARANAYCSIYNFQHFFKILSTALNKAALSEQAGLFDAASVY